MCNVYRGFYSIASFEPFSGSAKGSFMLSLFSLFGEFVFLIDQGRFHTLPVIVNSLLGDKITGHCKGNTQDDTPNSHSGKYIGRFFQNIEK